MRIIDVKGTDTEEKLTKIIIFTQTIINGSDRC